MSNFSSHIPNGEFMKRKDAEFEAKKLWINWVGAKNKYGKHFGVTFYGWLQRNHPHLLNFKVSGDRYQTVSA